MRRTALPDNDATAEARTPLRFVPLLLALVLYNRSSLQAYICVALEQVGECLVLLVAAARV